MLMSTTFTSERVWFGVTFDYSYLFSSWKLEVDAMGEEESIYDAHPLWDLFFAHFVNGHHMFINLFCGGLYNCPTYILFICLFYPINKRCIFYPINVYWLEKIYKHYFSFWPFVLVFLLTHFRFLQLCFHIVLERYFVLAYTYNQIYLAW